MNNPDTLAASYERFAEMRRISTLDEVILWIMQNSAMFYANGREHGDHLTAIIPEEPSWRFTRLQWQQSRFREREDEPHSCSANLLFTIEGNDPYWTIRRMFRGTGIELLSMAEGWHDYRANVRITSEEWPSLFVRRRLERLDD